MSAFESLYGGQFTLSTQLMKPNYLIRKLEWYRYNIDACLQLVKLSWNELFGSWEIANQHVLFFSGELRSSVRISHGSANFDFCSWATPIIITSMPMFAASRAKVEHSNLFVKIVNQYFEREFFSAVPVPKFRQGLCENQGRESFVLISLGEFFFTLP